MTTRTFRSTLSATMHGSASIPPTNHVNGSSSLHPNVGPIYNIHGSLIKGIGAGACTCAASSILDSLILCSRDGIV